MNTLKSIGVLFVLSACQVFACTTALLSNDSEKSFANNYDWFVGSGAIHVNQRDVLKHSVPVKPTDKPALWLSKYGSVTINQHGKEFPLSGMNEAGLAVAIMWLNATVYPKPDERPSINELQWIQYQLDNYATVEELVKDLPELRLSNLYAKVHYFACDRSGACASIESLEGDYVVHHERNLRVRTLTNDDYQSSVKHLEKHIGFGGQTAIPTDDGSLSRFVRASALGQEFSKKSLSSLGSSFALLESVSQKSSERFLTQFSAVYDLKRSQLHLKTHKNRQLRWLKFSQLNFDCRRPTKYIEIHQERGKLNRKLKRYSYESNEKSIEAGMKPLGISKELMEVSAKFPDSTVCLR